MASWFPLINQQTERNIASRGQVYIGRATVTSPKTRLKHRYRFHVWEPATQIAFVYGNKYIVGGGEANGLNAINILKVAAEVNGVTTPVLWGGGRTHTVAIGALRDQTDWLNLTVSAGDDVWCRAEYDVAVGTNTFVNGKLYSAFESEQSWIYDPVNEVDDVDSTGSMTQPTGGTLITSYSPMLLIGITSSGATAIIGLGDSIGDGKNDEAKSGLAGGGFLRRAAWSLGKPYCSGALDGYKANDFTGGHTLLSTLMQYHTDGVVELATNDLQAGSSSATTLGLLRTIWSDLSTNLKGRKKILQTNVIPRVTSTDKCVTLANQTAIAGFTTGAARDVFNSALAAEVGSNGLTAIIDTTSTVQDVGVPTKWVARVYSSTLAASMLSTAATASINAAPTVLEALVFDADNSAGQLGPLAAYIARTVTGTGPFTVTTSNISTVGVAENSGNEVNGTSSYDGIHPQQLPNGDMAVPVIAALV